MPVPRAAGSNLISSGSSQLWKVHVVHGTRSRIPGLSQRGQKSARREIRGTGKNISGVSIVTPRERNDSAFRQEKCRPGIFLLLFLSFFSSSSSSFSYFSSSTAIVSPSFAKGTRITREERGTKRRRSRKRGENKMGRSKWKKRKKWRGGGRRV